VVAAAMPAAAAPVALAPVPVLAPAATSPMALWEQIVAALRDGKPALAAVLAHGVADTVGSAKIVVRFPEGSFFGRQAEEREAKEGLADAAAIILGQRPAIEIAFSNGAAPVGTTVAQLEESRRDERREETKRRALSHPRVVEAMEVFDAKGNPDIVSVQVED